MILIIVFTPLFIYGLYYSGFLEGGKRLEIILLLLTTISICIMYTVFYGSISGRYRIQLVPAFYIFSFYGLMKLSYFYNINE